MKDVIIKCGKGEVEKTLAYIEKKDRKVKWATGDKPTGCGSLFERKGVYLIVENDVLTFIEIEELEDSDKRGKDVVSANEFLGKNSKPSIVIFRRGRNVIAKDVTTGNEGIAKCSPDDCFVFKTGASIAMARLMAKTPDALNHDVKDEWVKALGLTPVEKKSYTDADRNFKVGDRAVVRDWDDMAKEYGVFGSGAIKCTNGFTRSMRHLCGRTATVESVNDTSITIDFDDKSGDTHWLYANCMFNPIDSGKPTPKFKVGDYVTLKEGLTVGKMYGSLTLWPGRMYGLANGKRLEVEDVKFFEDDGMYHYHCKTTDHDRYYYTEAMLDKWDENKICEGDKVRIKKRCTGMRYDTYYEWVKEHITDPELLLAFEREDHVDTSLDYEVVKIAPHKLFSQKPVAYIKYKGTFSTLCYLFDIEALEKV